MTRMYFTAYELVVPLIGEKMFMNFLETMHPDDAELHIAAKDKKFSVPTPMFKGVTKKLVKETWPNLIKE